MDTATAGPSRLPTITTEDEEMAAEAGSSVPQTSNSPHPNGANGEGVANGGVTPGGNVKVEAQEGEAPVDPNALPEGACETIYIQNLNEKVQVLVMKQTLQNLFKPYRPVLPIIAHKNLRMAGQAFVTFPDVETANRVRKEVHEFPLYGKSMVLDFARSRSDSIVQKTGGEEALEAHKKQRLADKKRKRFENPLRLKAMAKRRAATTDADAVPAAAAPQKKARVAVPDEYLPPNNILFIQNLPDGTTSDDLREVFELHAGLVEIRTIPAKKDIAFIEYADEATAMVAKEALHNFKIDGETKMKVTYARR